MLTKSNLSNNPSENDAMALSSPSVVRTVALVICLSTMSVGCASLRPQWLGGEKSLPIASTSQAKPPLKDPSGKSLAIALETARLAEQRGMDREAISAYLNVRRQQPDRPGVAHALAVLYDRVGRVDDAAAEFQRALNEQPNDPDLLCDYGYFQYSSRQYDEAAASYTRALDLNPQHRQSKVNLAVLRAHQGRDEDATKLFTEAIGPAAARHNLGVIKLQQGDQQTARALLADASARDPSVAQKAAAVLSTLDRINRGQQTENAAIARQKSSASQQIQPAGFLHR